MKKKEIKNVGPFFKDSDLRKRPKGQEHAWYNVINIEGDMSSINSVYELSRHAYHSKYFNTIIQAESYIGQMKSTIKKRFKNSLNGRSSCYSLKASN